MAAYTAPSFAPGCGGSEGTREWRVEGGGGDPLF
jgi:hypothetical protein